jgi:hypothetical protein
MINFKTVSDQFVQARYDALLLQSNTLMQIFQPGNDKIVFAKVMLSGQLFEYGSAKPGQFVV